ncbi:MAG: LPS export ABC transporter permease LptF [Alphaproteobacteria bacterium]
MPAVSRYIIFQIAGPLGFFIFSLTGVIWLTQSLRLLDIIITKGQSAATYIAFTALVIPSVLSLILPIAFFCAVLYALYRLSSDHELVVLSATGLSAWGIVRPLLQLACCVTAAAYVINLWLMPMANTRLKDQVMEIRADLAATLLKEGAFSNPILGLTVYIRERDSNGDMRGILVHDNRQLNNPITYMAERGALVKTGAGPRLIMLNGNVQRRAAQKSENGGSLSLLYFDRYVYDLSEFMSGEGVRWKEPEERYLSELFFPDETLGDQTHREEFLAEAHRRLSSPLYVFAFAIIALAVQLSAQFSRRSPFWRPGAALAIAVAIRLGGLGLENLVEKNPLLIPGLYLWPLLVTAGGLFLLSDEGQRRMRTLRIRPFTFADQKPG